ncbi:sigma-54 interaction domain-containing protein [Sphingomonas nostoxanthinifaciens]|uniref:sigma-54 interaction domain-containing protein n=1 Tax=Sphingomonas nostoxanthinifaciens TaxID=2872652 RepID=UPI001CC1C4AE|nr:sigma 54-interacting transcriptional regulator [Sphingomonas nostoxanthinifaciens]UAK26036.1 sigma 54-interacting transcriptional regulator [Sphingomonas nostoxanthinifaciens]
MGQVGISEKAAAANPALAAWLAGVGLPTIRIAAETPAPRDLIRIIDESERAHARHTDILLALRDGAPSLVRAAKGQPAAIAFGFSDMAFGHALIAELIRPASRPACGEPESAGFLTLAGRIAKADATVLVLGETGTGKEGLARFIHAASSRAGGPFVAVNCAALPETMLEAMLFGHQKGAFTGAAGSGEGLFRAADGGTLLLDEIAELPLALQSKLLRAIQEREVLPIGATKPVPINVRIVAAANRDLATEVAEGRFRADLYWRLNVMPLMLKPLAERRLDVRAITATLMLRHLGADESFPWPTGAAIDRLMSHGWPGNVRELENVLQRALLLRAGDRIDAEDITLEAGTLAAAQSVRYAPTPAQPAAVSPLRLSDAARSSEMRAIEEALEATGGHRLRAAQRLGISERTLRYRLADMRAAA